MDLSFIHHAPFYQLAALLALASILGLAALRLRQPLVIAFIAAGLLAGPGVMGLAAPEDPLLVTLSELGVALLLFMVGLKLDLGLIRTLGPVAIMAGLAQIVLTTALGAALGLALGLPPAGALIAGFCLSLSSTIIVVKLLSDRRTIDSLYGRMALGILIVQDFVVIAAMVAVAGMGGDGIKAAAWVQIAGLFAVMAIGTALFVRFAAARLTARLATDPELMVIAAIGLAAGMAAICHHLGLGRELGGLIAGIALASTPQHHMIAARLAGLRDFLLLFFFIGLGAALAPERIGALALPAAALSIFVLVGKPALVAGVLVALGYKYRTGLLTGIALSQISEFSMIFAAAGFAAGLVDENFVVIITITGMITIVCSTYMAGYAEALSGWLEKQLRSQRGGGPPTAEALESNPPNAEVLVFGLGRYGLSMARELKDSGFSVLAIDFDPQAISAAAQHGITALYGDAADPALPRGLPLGAARAAVFAFQHHGAGPLHTDLRRTLARALREQGFNGLLAATAHNRADEESLHRDGIDIVLRPFEDAARGGFRTLAARLSPVTTGSV